MALTMHIYLQTTRLVLRRFTSADVDDLVELDSDPEVMRFLNGGTPTPRDAIEHQVLPRFLAFYDRSEAYGYWAAIERSTNTFLGWFSLHPTGEHEGDVAQLGYRLRRAAWGKGYATEGARALIDKGFGKFGMQRVIATTYEHNIASRRVMEKVGMELVRTFRYVPGATDESGTFIDELGAVWDGEDVEYALDRADWTRKAMK